MGVDISGWVEVFDPYTGTWDGVVKINYLVGRTEAVYAALFGVQNEWRFIPVAPDRGMPMNASAEVLASAEMRRVSKRVDYAPSWIAQSEIESISWDSPVPTSDSETSQVMLFANLLTPGWKIVLDIMTRLAEQYGARGVRLVAWFVRDSSPPAR